MLIKKRYVCTELLRLCIKRRFSGDQERELETLSRMSEDVFSFVAFRQYTA